MIDVPALQPVNPLGAIAQAQQLRASQQEMAMRNQAMQQQSMQMEMQQRQMDSQNAMMDAYSQAGGDPNKALALAQKSGKVLPQDLMNAQKGLLEMRKQTLDYVNQVGAKAIRDSDLIQGAHDQVMAAPAEQRPMVYQQTLQALKNAQVDVSNVPPQYPGDQAFAQMGLALKTHDQLVKEAADQLGMAKTKAETAKDTAQAAEATANEKLNTAKAAFYAQNGLTPGISPEEAGLASYLKNNPGKTPQDFLAWRAKLAPTATFNLQAGLLSDQAKQMAAQNYQQTGQLPAGMRSPAMGAQILNQAAAGGPVNIAGNKATYQANADSLKSMQKNFDNVTAFENTAGKNLDQFLGAAKKMVDTGSPFLNTPVRMLNDKMIGSENMAAVNAARTTALTEIAKVLSSANAGSGVVSDSARHEVEGLISPNATLKQIYAAATILKQDMANRHAAYADQLQQIKSRMGGSQPSNGNSGGSNGEGGLTITLPSGKVVKIN